MAEPFTIYKLTILYMLDKAGFPLTNTQISNFFLEQEYTDYFRVQEVIGDLVNADLINFESTHSNTQYTLTAAGRETLGFFKDKITDGIENDVKRFFEKNKLEFRQENFILADYYKTTNQNYDVRCRSFSIATQGSTTLRRVAVNRLRYAQSDHCHAPTLRSCPPPPCFPLSAPPRSLGQKAVFGTATQSQDYLCGVGKALRLASFSP